MPYRSISTVFAWTFVAASVATGVQAGDPPSFSEDILPILSAKCFACHGPDAGSRQADLRLDLPRAISASDVIVPGDPAASEFVRRIRAEDPDLRMPPPTSDKQLSVSERSTLVRWIASGAEWQPHWAFVPPRRPHLPRPPGCDDWAVNAIDHFILARLRGLELSPAPPASRDVLARRVALDLTGLPPDQTLQQAFDHDASAAAYSRYVASVLASPHAAEHRARYWLDAARYGDTHGMHMDNYREIWPYRDWVVSAFRKNLPFDEFVVQQLAGDLLPSATDADRIATGFNRCHVSTAEGGSIPAELEARYMIDRVQTTATVFMGLTAGCAACHDHKFDPITQRDFYRLGAFFNNTTQPAMDGNQKDTPPVLVIPDPAFAATWRQLQATRRNLRGRLAAYRSAADAWWMDVEGTGMRPRELVHPVASDGLILWLPLAEGEGDAGLLPPTARWADDHPAGRRGMRFVSVGGLEVPVFGTLRTDQPLTLSFWFRPPDQLVDTTLFSQAAAGEGAWRLTCSTRSRLEFRITDADGQSITGLLPGDSGLEPRTWQHICIRYSGGQSNVSISMLVNGQPVRLRPDSLVRIGATRLTAAPLRVAGKLPSGGLSDIRIFERWMGNEEAMLLAREHDIRRFVRADKPWRDRSIEERTLLKNYFEYAVDKDFQQIAFDLSQTERLRDTIYAQSTTTFVTEERSSSIPKARVLERGQYDRPLEEVTAGVPAFLPPLDRSGVRNRLALARWLVHRDHPLTARVTVNRIWQSIFGTGLVRTAEDFGTMGEPPSHPELLDWLAVEFMESGWDVHHVLRLILTSATYRQQSRSTPAKQTRDPANRFLSRGPRFRLDAEVLRDQALAVSGLLQRELGGPPVKPYQPGGLWRTVAIGASNTSVFRQDSGADLYRRSIYTFWKRTAPPPAMSAFDAPTREECHVRRERTNTPLQALVLMNDPQFVEAARLFAERALAAESTAEHRAAWLLRKALMRSPTRADVADLVAAARQLTAAYANDEAAARALIETGESTPAASHAAPELAAWTMVASIVMNRDDFLHKD